MASDDDKRVNRLWEERTGKPVSDEQVRAIRSNLQGFFALLREWSEAEDEGKRR